MNSLAIGKVFVAMPYKKDDRFERLWDNIRVTCHNCDLYADRVDKAPNQGVTIEDIQDRIRMAEGVIAVLTDMNPNVVYEFGFARATHEKDNVILLMSERSPKLPFDLNPFTYIPYNDSVLEDLGPCLMKALVKMKARRAQVLISDPSERTKQVIEDLEVFLKSRSDVGHRNEEVYHTCFLSAFAIPDCERSDCNDGSLPYNELLDERTMLENLARDGCNLKFIIAPRTPTGTDDYVYHRLKRLQEFLEHGESEVLDHTDWVFTPFRQNNVFVIGKAVYLEGFKSGKQRASEFTLRMTDPSAIYSHTVSLKALFEQLAKEMLGRPFEDSPKGRTARRGEVIKKLEELRSKVK